MTTLITPYIDTEGTLRKWLNTLSGPSGLVGNGNPLSLGVYLKRLRSPARGAYALISTVGTPIPLVEEQVTCQTRISASVYGITKENANLAANAYANWLLRIPLLRPVVDTVQIVAIDGITGPINLPDLDEERYLVDADIYFTTTQTQFVPQPS